MLDLSFRADRTSEAPVYRQLAEHLLALIDAGRLRPGERLPPSRDLAAALGLSRNTVSRALDDLAAAGLVDAHVGRGTFVAPRVPRLRGAARGEASAPAARPFAWQALLSARTRALRAPRDPVQGIDARVRFDFRAGHVDAGALPIADVQRAWQRALGRLPECANDFDPMGHLPLLAAHLEPGLEVGLDRVVAHRDIAQVRAGARVKVKIRQLHQHLVAVHLAHGELPAGADPGQGRPAHGRVLKIDLPGQRRHHAHSRYPADLAHLGRD